MGSYRTLSEGQEWSSKPAIAGTMPGSSNNTVRGRSSRGVTKRFVATALASVIRSTFATAEIPELHYESPRYKMLQSNSSRGDAEKSHLPDAGNKGIVKLEVGEILEELSILESQKSTVKSSYSAFRRMLLQFQSPIIEELYFRRDLLYGAVIIIRSSALLNVFTVATIFGFFRSGTWYEQPIWISLLAAIGILSLAYLSAAIWKDGYALVQLAFVSDFGRTIMVALNAVSSIFFPIVDFCLSKNPFDVVGPFATVVIIAECSLSGISASFREMLFHFSLVMSISGVKAIYIALSWRNALGAFLYVIPILMCNLLVIESLYYQDKKRRTTFLKAELAALQLEELEAERKRTEHLLSLVLPPSVVEELRKIRVMKFETVAHWMESGTVMFMDLKNFTQLSERLESKQDAVLMLNMIFQKVDEVLTKFPEIERVKTIKSKLLLLGGLKSTNHLARMIDFALAIRRTFRDKVIFEMPSKIHPKIMRAHLKFGFGLQTGSLMTGIVGKRVFCFEVYGDTVNTASRMLSIAKGHQIIVPAELWCKVCERYRGESIGQRFVKGKGFMDIYSVEGSSSDGIHQQQSLFSAPTKDEGEMDLGAGEGGESSMLKVSKLATPRIDPIIISRVSKSSSSASLDPNRIPSNRGSSIPRASIIECVDESAESSNEGTLQKPFQSGRKPSRTGVHREPSWTSARLGRIFPVDNSSSPPSVDAAGFTGRSNQSSDAANGVRSVNASSAAERKRESLADETFVEFGDEMVFSGARVAVIEQQIDRHLGMKEFMEGHSLILDQASSSGSGDSIIEYKPRAVTENSIPCSDERQESYSLADSPLSLGFVSEQIGFNAQFLDQAMESKYLAETQHTVWTIIRSNTVKGVFLQIGLFSLAFLNVYIVLGNSDELPNAEPSTDPRDVMWTLSSPATLTVVICFGAVAFVAQLAAAVASLFSPLPSRPSQRAFARISILNVTIVACIISFNWSRLHDYAILSTFVIPEILTVYILTMVALPLTERIALSVLQAVVLIACGCTIHQNYWLIPLIPTVLLVVFGGTFLLRESLLRLDYLMDETLAAQAEMTEEESRKSSHLLKTVLPSRLIQGLLSDPSATLYEEFPLVTVLQMDIMGFTAMSSLLDPLRVFQMINNMFTYFDALTAEYGVEKITTIGDAYVACSSLTVGTDQRLSATAVCLVALLMQAFVNEKLNASPFMKTVLKHQCAMRIGVHTGPCYGSIAGGSTNFRFDLGGSTVDIAEKIQEHCEPGEVYISRVTRDLITFNTAFDIVDKNLCTAGEEIFLLRLKKLW